MGTADAIPGVSGGTVALILRIYERLVTAISHFDLTLLQHVRRKKFVLAAQHIDLRFLISLGFGIAIGLVGMLLVLGDLLKTPNTRPYTLAVFLGTIVASCILVGKMVDTRFYPDKVVSLLLGLFGAAVAFSIYWFTTFGERLTESNDPSYLYLFCCGAIAICAMILPGISGAMILLLFGVYTYLSDLGHGLKDGHDIGTSLLTIAVFGSGCAIGLISFSKVLRKLLRNYPSHTMATMCGFMMGALPKLWPFDIAKGGDPDHPRYYPLIPDTLDGQVLGVVVIALAAFVAVLVIDHFASRDEKTERPAN